MNNKTINKHYVYSKYMDNNLPDKTVLDVSDKFKSILGFKIENITFKRNDFKIDQEDISILQFHYTSKKRGR